MDVFSSITALSVGAFTLATLLPTLLVAIVALIAIRVFMKIVARVLAKTTLDTRVQRYAVAAIKFALYLLAILVIMAQLGIEITSLVAILSVCSLGLTLAAEDILGNLAGGLVIIASHPFALGDFIEASGVCGTVEHISLNHTKVITPDGLMVMLPNKALSTSQMTNYTVLGTRRVTQKVTASYGAATEDVKAACYEALSNTDLILDDPGSAVYVSNYGESSIEYTIFAWCKAENYWPVYFGLGEALRPAFANHKVEMTYDHLNIHIVEK
ncbi:mechanosensitive ion channel family protein [Bengtsoniella intestinalis]|uniref:mechanosensitive ion channel family protein n=1 Tax=Bengtsoniella intestinalis TaxID=3073143 RepID=UPI00391F0A5E